MNRLLAIIVVILVPLAVCIKPEEESREVALFGGTLENITIPVQKDEESSEEEVGEEDIGRQVLISNNRDKSNAFYVDLEDYVVGVVAGEMPASFNKEALKAQAVAARTYALFKTLNINNYVLSTNVNDQVYLSEVQMKNKWGNDFEHYYKRVREAALETKGQVLTYEGKIISAYYFAISNGYTDEAKVVFKEDKDYLVSVESAWDKSFSSYKSERSILKSNFCSKLGITCGEIRVSNVIRSDSHYVRELVINDKKFTGLEVFNKLGLKSTDFTIEVNGENVIITTYGFGHGVGMSQYGAQGMAGSGYSYEDILKHYYKNTEISNI